MALQGNLRDMSIADLIQHNGADRKTARLTIDHDGRQATLYFLDGNVVHAAMGRIQGEEVIYRILDWESGTFMLEPDETADSTTITRSWSSLLLEGARRLDEGLPPSDDLTGSAADQTETEVNTMAQKMDDILKEMGGEVNGFLAAAVTGMDGLNIAQFTKNSKLNPDIIGAQMALLVKLVDTTMIKLGAGEAEDDLLTTENAYILFRFLPEKHYFLGIAADRKTASLGNLRLMSRTYAKRLSEAVPR